MKNKKFKHKWWKHLIYKYKVVETETEYHKHYRFRHWFPIALAILAIILSPLIILGIVIYTFTYEHKAWFDYEEDSYIIYYKEEVSNEL